MKSILDKSFVYTPSYETDLKKKFAQVRKQMRKEEPQQATAEVTPPSGGLDYGAFGGGGNEYVRDGIADQAVKMRRIK